MLIGQGVCATILARSFTQVLTAAPRGGEHSHFLNEETEPQEGSVISQGHATSKQQSGDLNLRVSDFKCSLTVHR